jgi:hypothetical protein
VGYAAISGTILTIKGGTAAVAQDGIFITAMNKTATVETESQVNFFYASMFESKIVLNETNNFSETFEVTVFNKTDREQVFIAALTDFSDDTLYDNENIEFVCTSIVVSPSIDYDITINNDEVKMKLELENGEFNVLDFYPFNLYYSNGEEILVTNLSIINIDGYLEISFKLPDISKKIIYFELENAYEITNIFGVKENKTIKTILYLN